MHGTDWMDWIFVGLSCAALLLAVWWFWDDSWDMAALLRNLTGNILSPVQIVATLGVGAIILVGFFSIRLLLAHLHADDKPVQENPAAEALHLPQPKH